MLKHVIWIAAGAAMVVYGSYLLGGFPALLVAAGVLILVGKLGDLIAVSRRP